MIREDAESLLKGRAQGNSEVKLSPIMQELVNAERLYSKLQSDFRTASVYACHMVIKKNPAPLNIFNLMGDEGDKFVVGGIFVHKARDWTVCGQ
jgi:hypothetical protein